jgi:hypothetical protein
MLTTVNAENNTHVESALTLLRLPRRFIDLLGCFNVPFILFLGPSDKSHVSFAAYELSPYSTFSRSGATFTLSHRLAGRKVINEDNVLKRHGNLSMMLK